MSTVLKCRIFFYAEKKKVLFHKKDLVVKCLFYFFLSASVEHNPFQRFSIQRGILYNLSLIQALCTQMNVTQQ